MLSTNVIGLDRDGTINRDLGTYVTDSIQFDPIPGSLEAVALMQKKGYNIVIITNQAGIMKGLMSTKDLELIHNHMISAMIRVGCLEAPKIYYSKTNLKDDVFAKPNIGMFKLAEAEMNISFNGGVYVGDKITDLEVADKVGAVPILVKTGYGIETVEKLKSNTELFKKTQIFDNLWEFANSLPWIK